jgi:hypothetical protein
MTPVIPSSGGASRNHGMLDARPHSRDGIRPSCVMPSKTEGAGNVGCFKRTRSLVCE